MSRMGLRGSILDVLNARVTEDSLHSVPLPATGFSFGLGAIGATQVGAVERLGELWTAAHLAAVLPGLTPGEPRLTHSPGERVFTPFNVVLQGMDDLPVVSLSERALSGIGKSDEWMAAWVAHAEREGWATPLYGVVHFVEFESLRGAYVKQPPVPERAPGEGRTISDPEVHGQWFGVQPDGGAAGVHGLVIGAALHPDEGRRSSLDGREGDIFYRHPSAEGEPGLMLHQHVVLFRGVTLPEPGTPLLEAAARWVTEGDPLDVKHVLDDSRIRSSVGAVMGYDAVGEPQ